MKIISSILAITLTVYANGQYVNQIVQSTEHPEGPVHAPIVSFMENLASSGATNARDEARGTTVFELHTTHAASGESYLLDEKTVSTYHPQATISIVTEDSYEAIPRTRIDRPFTVNYTVTGIVTDDPEVQDAAKSVVFDHRVYTYAAGGTEIVNPEVYTTKEHDEITKNGNDQLLNITTSIQASDLTKARGEEVFSIFANPDFGVIGATQLDSARVQIWPIADGSISGVDETKSYNVVPTISITTTDLYPDSNTYLRYYKIDDPENPETSGFIGNYRPNSNIPVDRDWNVQEMNQRLVEDGVYFVELLHTTVFDTIRLGNPIKITVDRVIKVKGSIISSE